MSDWTEYYERAESNVLENLGLEDDDPKPANWDELVERAVQDIFEGAA